MDEQSKASDKQKISTKEKLFINANKRKRVNEIAYVRLMFKTNFT